MIAFGLVIARSSGGLIFDAIILLFDILLFLVNLLACYVGNFVS